MDGRLESNGNFHGAPLGHVLDFLAIAVELVASGAAVAAAETVTGALH